MSAVVYLPQGERQWVIKSFPSLRGAKIALSRKLSKKYPGAIAMEWEQFQKEVVKPIKVKSIFGVECEISSDCPRSCDPSSELYWSM